MDYGRHHHLHHLCHCRKGSFTLDLPQLSSIDRILGHYLDRHRGEDEFIFRRNRGFRWEDYMDEKKLPIGIAAFVSFLIGWAGAIVCMGQTYYYGPIAKMVGDYGADVRISPLVQP